jgi:hypothetical protein
MQCGNHNMNVANAAMSAAIDVTRVHHAVLHWMSPQ